MRKHLNSKKLYQSEDIFVVVKCVVFGNFFCFYRYFFLLVDNDELEKLVMNSSKDLFALNLRVCRPWVSIL